MLRSGLKYKLSCLHSSPSRRGKLTSHVASGTNTPPVQSPEWGEGKLGERFYYGGFSTSSHPPLHNLMTSLLWPLFGR